MNPVDEWIIASASVIGSSHQKTSAPCQDASVIQISESGEWVAIVVSDGAGTASHSQEGSSFLATFFARSLISLSAELSSRAPGQWINDYVIERILEARHSLRAKADSDDISKYHCTLVACLLGPSGGFAIHIGDGAIFGGRAGHGPISGEAELNDNFFISAPDNGEYSNETYFVTEGNWIKNLRITPMPRLDWIYACTDGGTALSMVSDKEPKEGFIVPVLKEVLNKSNTADRNATLVDILANPQADKVTGDDKTIAIACRASLKKSSSVLRFQSQGRTQNISAKIEPVADIATGVPKGPPARPNQTSNRKQATLLRAFAYALASLVIVIITAFVLFKLGALGVLDFGWLQRSAPDTTIPRLPAHTLPKANDVGGKTGNWAVPAKDSPGTRELEKPVASGAGGPAEAHPFMPAPASNVQGSSGREGDQIIRPGDKRPKAQVLPP